MSPFKLSFVLENRMKRLFEEAIRQEDRGVAAIEFALLAPVLLIMFVGLFDVTNLIYCHNKMERTAQDVNNIITRGDTTKTQLDDMLRAADYTAQPFNLSKFGNVIVTSVSQTNSDTKKPAQVMWRDSYPGGTSGSRINVASLPGGLVLDQNETVIFTEVFFTFQPIFPGYVVLSNQTDIYSIAAGVPRQGTMTTLPP